MADLDGSFARALIRRAHELSVLHGERHSLFLIDVLPGIKCGDEAFGMQVVRRGNNDSVNRFIVEQRAEIAVELRACGKFFRVFEAARVDVGEGGEFRTGAGGGLARQLRPALANANHADAYPLVRSQHTSGSQAADSGSDVTDEVSARLHGTAISLAPMALYSGILCLIAQSG